MFKFIALLSLILQSSAWAAEPEGTFYLRTELGPLWQSSNQVQIPADTGTRFDFTSLGKGPALFYRFDSAWKISERSEIRALYAPLSLTVTGRLKQQVNFQGTSFSPNSDTEGLYRFNSYRVTYRYRFIQSEHFKLLAGITAKIRDAEIRLTQGSTSANRSNVGFVPLLHLLAEYSFTSHLTLVLDADALAAPQGRAEDIGLLLKARISPHFELLGGYRTIEGGSSGGGGNVYNFAWLNFGVLGLSWNN